MSQTASTAVAIYAATVGTGSLGLAALAYRTSRESLRLDAPMLQVTTGDRLDSDGFAAVDVQVANTGKRPTSLVSVGLHFDVDPGENAPQLGSVLLTDPFNGEDPRELGSGQVANFQHVFSDRPLPCHIDTPLTAWAQDARGSTTSAAPAQFFRGWIESGWEPPAGTDPRHLAQEPPEANYDRSPSPSPRTDHGETLATDLMATREDG